MIIVLMLMFYYYGLQNIQQLWTVMGNWTSAGNYLHEQENRTATFYHLPKFKPALRQTNNFSKWMPTQWISQLVDHFLNPISTANLSYIKDTTHFLQILQEVRPLPDNCLLVIFHVTSLFTNIPRR